MPTPTMEDYIEVIYNLIDSKGYARVSDIAEKFSIHPSSVTKMIQKLDKDEYVVYEKYRGFTLTKKGKTIGEKFVYRHDLLEDFLEIIGVDEEHIYNDVEGIEHHLSWHSVEKIGCLVKFFKSNPHFIEKLKSIDEQEGK